MQVSKSNGLSRQYEEDACKSNGLSRQYKEEDACKSNGLSRRRHLHIGVFYLGRYCSVLSVYVFCI